MAGCWAELSIASMTQGHTMGYRLLDRLPSRTSSLPSDFNRSVHPPRIPNFGFRDLARMFPNSTPALFDGNESLDTRANTQGVGPAHHP